MLAKIPSATIVGVHGSAVTVEVYTGQGLPGFRIVGLPDAACREARDRVQAAIRCSGFEWPSAGIVVNLAPTTERKTGAGLDVAIAIGVLAVTDQVEKAAAESIAYLGELGLDGSVRPVPGVAPMVAAIDGRRVDGQDLGRDVVVPEGNAAEALIATTAQAFVATDLAEVVAAVRGDGQWRPAELVAGTVTARAEPPPDLADVRGQPVAREALEIAAAGGHHLLFVGSPGSGKSMLAHRLSGVLPKLARAQALETTMVHSAAGLRLTANGLLEHPPCRAPHHTTSSVALVGGGSATLRPGEASLAHNGVLVLDELGEFKRSGLEALREPLEDGVIRVARANARAVLPARFLLVATSNPCPCGGGPPGACQCGDAARARYLRKLSGPLADRFDLRVVVHRPRVDDLFAASGGEPSAMVRQRVAAARVAAIERAGKLNAQLGTDDLDAVAPLSEAAAKVLRGEVERGRLTGRGFHRVRRTARTIADLRAPGSEVVGLDEVEVALTLRVAMPRLGDREESRWIA